MKVPSLSMPVTSEVYGGATSAVQAFTFQVLLMFPAKSASCEKKQKRLGFGKEHEQATLETLHHSGF